MSLELEDPLNDENDPSHSPHNLEGLLATFDSLDVEKKREALEAMEARLEQLDSETPEITVVGGYMRHFEDNADVKRPLPPNEAKALAGLTHRPGISSYLNSLPDQELLGKYRYIQYRFIEDGSLWHAYGFAHVHRETSGWTKIPESDLVPLEPN